MQATHSFSLMVFVLLVTIEISFTQSIWLNIFIFGLAVLYLLFLKKWGGLLAVFLVPLIPAFATFWSIYLHGSSTYQAWLLFTRTFSFAALGMILVFGIDLEELFLFLEQKRVPATFIYGILVVIHAMPDIRREVVSIREASLLRGKPLHVWSPMLYVKTILTAFTWRDKYTEAMFSRGFDDNGIRVPQHRFYLSKKSIALLATLFIICQILVFY
ncbi:cobalt ABC transporter permease [Vagococcus penaei]|uniref:Cobalt ABC transporter permease n=1 Tax=Vagococcus penaei TaxID=633807 RepID=A0A1Q2D343_9ENTE|nr:energy-coupling factor transporter transmembrane component T [Vagococcus penaei]AQP52768.1 cobalt ABC transporter permease [Vagococcus penaei]RST98456.1 cobalt ABC transporter permease [Vagococcus penaei]